ncbi:MAG: hypothetical protein MZU91_14480 [Desulfosudis oleivorans]|nr:hypothetical protein [Desulfosudis oleivorans]
MAAELAARAGAHPAVRALRGRRPAGDRRLRRPTRCRSATTCCSGGEVAAMVVVDAVARLRARGSSRRTPLAEESFSARACWSTRTTRGPEEFRGHARAGGTAVGGNHAEDPPLAADAGAGTDLGAAAGSAGAYGAGRRSSAAGRVLGGHAEEGECRRRRRSSGSK